MQRIDLIEIINFEWDEGNIKKNEIKHDVNQKESEEIYFDEPIYLKDFKHSISEERFYVFGQTRQKRNLTIIFTIRNNKIRIISARDQNKKEKRFYIKNLIVVKNTYEKTKKAAKI